MGVRGISPHSKNGLEPGELTGTEHAPMGPPETAYPSPRQYLAFSPGRLGDRRTGLCVVLTYTGQLSVRHVTDFQHDGEEHFLPTEQEFAKLILGPPPALTKHQRMVGLSPHGEGSLGLEDHHRRRRNRTD